MLCVLVIVTAVGNSEVSVLIHVIDEGEECLEYGKRRERGERERGTGE